MTTQIVGYIIRYQGAPYGFNEQGHEVARSTTLGGIDRAWHRECRHNPHDHVMLAVMDDGRELRLDDAEHEIAA